MESFEITFFFPKNSYNEDSVSIINEHFLYSQEFCSKTLIEFFDYEDKSFAEIRISLFDFKANKENFMHIFQKISKYISSIMQEMTGVLFATGIYELTYCLAEDKKHLYEFDTDFMKKFPIVFFRTGQSFIQGKAIFNDKYIICMFYEEAQAIF